MVIDFIVRYIYWVFFVYAFPEWCHLRRVCQNSSINGKGIRWQGLNLPFQPSDVLSCCIIKCCFTEVTSNPPYIHDSHLPVIYISLSNHLSPNHQHIQNAEPAVLPRDPKPIDCNILTIRARCESVTIGSRYPHRGIKMSPPCPERIRKLLWWCTGGFKVDWVFGLCKVADDIKTFTEMFGLNDKTVSNVETRNIKQTYGGNETITFLQQRPPMNEWHPRLAIFSLLKFHVPIPQPVRQLRDLLGRERYDSGGPNGQRHWQGFSRFSNRRGGHCRGGHHICGSCWLRGGRQSWDWG